MLSFAAMSSQLSAALKEKEIIFELMDERQRQCKVSMNHEELPSSCTAGEIAVVDVQQLTDVQQ